MVFAVFGQGQLYGDVYCYVCELYRMASGDVSWMEEEPFLLVEESGGRARKDSFYCDDLCVVI